MTVKVLPEHDVERCRDDGRIGAPAEPHNRMPGSSDDSAEPLGREASSTLFRLKSVCDLYPQKIALDDGATQLTYGALLQVIYGLAHQISRCAPSSKPLIALLCNNVAYPVVQFAAMFAGRPFLLVDVSDPIERKAKLVEALGADILITQSGTTPDLSFVPAAMTRITFDPMLPVSAPCPKYIPSDDDLMLLASTSGSTGDPKIIAQPGASLKHLVQRHTACLGVDQSDVIVSLSSLSFLGQRDSVVALLSGAKLRIVDMKLNGLSGSLAIMEAERATRLGFVPSALRMLVRSPEASSAFASLRSLDLVGEPVTVSDIALFRAVLPSSCRICVAFGSVEAVVLFRWIVENEELYGPSLPVGHPEQGRRISLVDEHGAPASPDDGGEIVVSDRFVALGFWSDGQLDSTRFPAVPDEPSARVYHTGDIVRLRPDGLAEFIGRRDRMIKVIGLKAELAEIEKAIRSIPGIADAVVQGLSLPDEATVIVAFLEGRAGGERPADAAIRRVVTGQTAPHMTPSVIQWLDALPRLANQKHDLVRLAAIARDRLRIDAARLDDSRNDPGR